MTLSDDQLLDFDHDQLADFDLDKARRDLAEHGDLYRSHLVLARWIDGWQANMTEKYRPDSSVVGDPEAWQEGFDFGIGELAAYLRQGYFLPGGYLAKDVEAGAP